MAALRAGNLAVKFALEIAAVAAFALRFRAPFELSVLALAALALLTASSAAAIAFASVFIINSVLLAVLGQWEA